MRFIKLKKIIAREKMKKKFITLAQIGCGYWGQNLLRNFSACKNCMVKYVVEINPQRRTYVKENYPSVIVTDNLQTIIADKEVDAVVIATLANTHYDLTKIMLKADKHVFVEKPLSMSTAEAKEIVRLSIKKQKKVCVGHTFIYSDAVRKIKEYIDNKDIGEIYYIFSQRLNLGKVRQDVNVMWNLAPHDISIVLYWLSEKPKSVFARGLTFLQNGIEDVAFIDLKFPSGKAVHIHESWLNPCKVRQMVIVGSKKMIVYDDTLTDSKITIYDKGIDRNTMHNPLTPVNNFGQFQLLLRSGNVLRPNLSPKEPLEIQAKHFIDCVLGGVTPQTDSRSGLEVVKILEAAQRSLEANREIKIS